jgi:ADP-dependent NAD(P)H-hydrate dehydratase
MSLSSGISEFVPDVSSLPERPLTAHKSQVGRIAILAGSRGMSGAAILCGLGALRSGAGLVRVYTSASAAPLVAGAEPSLMTVGLEEDALGCICGGAASAIDSSWANVLAIGPGLGRSPDLERIITAAIGNFRGPIVIDADGLNNVAGHKRERWLEHPARSTVVTPHPGEMTRLLRGLGLDDSPIGDEDEPRVRVAAEFARLTRTTVVLKGHRTVVTDGTRAFINTTGNPGMATGGMGDVLCGVVASLMGQGMRPFDAACLAAHVHGSAADRVARQIGPIGYLAREVADGLPQALADASRPRVGFR